MESEAAQAKDENVLNLMIKRKDLDVAGFSAFESDERLPIPQRNDNEPNKKRCRRVDKNEEEIWLYNSSSSGQAK